MPGPNKTIAKTIARTIAKRTRGAGNHKAQGYTTHHSVNKDIGNEKAKIDNVIAEKASGGGERGGTEWVTGPGVRRREEKGAEEEEEHSEVP